MLITRAPMRISLGGGGTDLESYYAEYGGITISTTINKYFYAIITTDESDDLQVISADYRSLFRHSPYNDLFWNGDLALPRAVLHEFGIRRGVNLFIASEVPPGTGLGSSSAAAATMVRALSTLIEQPMTKQQVAELASHIEIEKMGMPIGKQDQFAAAFGGLNKITFSSAGVTVEPLEIAPAVRQTLEHRLMLFFTGSSGCVAKRKLICQNDDTVWVGCKAIGTNQQTVYCLTTGTNALHEEINERAISVFTHRSCKP